MHIKQKNTSSSKVSISGIVNILLGFFLSRNRSLHTRDIEGNLARKGKPIRPGVNNRRPCDWIVWLSLGLSLSPPWGIPLVKHGTATRGILYLTNSANFGAKWKRKLIMSDPLSVYLSQLHSLLAANSLQRGVDAVNTAVDLGSFCLQNVSEREQGKLEIVKSLIHTF